jgi:hypothetical protein
MTGIVLIVIIWGILKITSGEDVIGGVLTILMIALSAGVGLWIALDDAKRKKDGERCMRNWEEYKRNNRNKL